MSVGFYQVPERGNDPNQMYGPGSPERKSLMAALQAAYDNHVEVPLVINGEHIKTDDAAPINPPHNHQLKIGTYYKANEEHVADAVDAALAAKKDWQNMAWEHRAAIFLKAADLIEGPYRDKINAATMAGQSKNAFQSEIDAASELIDFLRFNVKFATEIYQEQPISGKGMWNRSQYRPLEGFVVAITPFNFTAIAGNLPSAPALMGNTVVWKASDKQAYSAKVVMDVFEEAGLPKGVINLLFGSGKMTADYCFSHADFAGIHFTGSTSVFQSMWKKIGENITKYKSYPRIVGETGGKDFVMVHQSADVDEVAANLLRGAFEFQGQKCSAASRAYLPSNLQEAILSKLKTHVESLKMGDPLDFSNFINAVIDEGAFDKIKKYIDDAKASKDAEVIIGGNADKSKGYFIEPTVILAKDPHYVTMEEEIFGPVLTVYIYDADEYEKTLELVDNTSPYGLTGAIFSKDRAAAILAEQKLVHAAGNFYINDKPTGAVVGQQPFGGARASGTNDKAGAKVNLLRWVSIRTIKETFVPVKDYRYPFLGEE